MDEHAPHFDGQASFDHQPQNQDQPADGLPQARRRLGRGLSSLLGGMGESPSLMDEAALAEIPKGGVASHEYTLDEAKKAIDANLKK